MEYYVKRSQEKYFLEKIFLRLLGVTFFSILCGFNLFHEVAMPVTVQPGFIAVFAEVGGYVLFIQFKPCKNKIARQVY